MGNDVETASAPAPVAPVVKRALKGGSGQLSYAPRDGGRPVATDPPEDIVDTATLLGLPPDQIPGPVRATLAVLMAEIDRLREEMLHAHQRIAWLEERCDQHPDVPLPNRQAFLRGVSVLLHQADEKDEPTGLLVAFHVGGIEAIGAMAGQDAACAHVAAALGATLRQSDLVAYVGGGVFLICLAGAAGPAGEAKVARCAAELAGFEWLGTDYRFTVTTGLAVVRSGGTAALAMAEAVDSCAPGIRR